ncbi:MAG: outer membrane protein assembly factor BamB [Mariniblastus sp.]|jgi:outer membrane protein assembly factor BamB
MTEQRTSIFTHTRGIILCLLLITQGSFANADDDWPRFRGLAGNASASEPTPTTWSDSENLVWKTRLPGRGASSPIIVGNKIFLTSFTGYGQANDDPGEKTELRLNTLCFDRVTGELIWNKSIEGNSEEQSLSNNNSKRGKPKQVAGHGFASGTPCCDGKTVFAFFGASGAVAYDLDGQELWHNDELGTGTTGFGSASSPVEHENLVYINASIESDTLYALDKSTGKIVWKKDDVIKCWSSPCLAKNNRGETELIINQKFKVLGLDPQTGEQIWSCEGIEDYVVPTPISHQGIIYCLGGRSNKAMAIKLGGSGDVTQSHRLWITNIGANVTSPVLHDGHLYWASDKGIANCLDASNGEPVYRERMPTKARVYGSIVRSSDKLYLTTRDSGVWVLPAKPEFKVLALNTFDSEKGMFNASPAISHSQILMRTDNFLYCVGQN